MLGCVCVNLRVRVDHRHSETLTFRRHNQHGAPLLVFWSDFVGLASISTVSNAFTGEESLQDARDNLKGLVTSRSRDVTVIACPCTPKPPRWPSQLKSQQQFAFQVLIGSHIVITSQEALKPNNVHGYRLRHQE